MDIPDLPHGAFEHIGDRKIKPQGGGGGNPISAVTDTISSALGTDGGGGGVLGALADIDPGKEIGKGLADLDKFVGDEIPGGWKTVGLAAAAIAAPYAIGAMGAGAGTTAGGFVAADAAGMAVSGLSEAAIAQNLAMAGVEATIAADAAALAASGLSEAAIAQNLTYAYGADLGASAAQAATATSGAPVYDYSQQAIVTPEGNVIPATTPASEVAAMDAQIKIAGEEALKKYGGGLTVGQGLQAAQLGRGLLGGNQKQQQQNQYAQMAQRNTVPGGAVDYSGILNLLSPKPARRNPNSLLG